MGRLRSRRVTLNLDVGAEVYLGAKKHLIVNHIDMKEVCVRGVEDNQLKIVKIKDLTDEKSEDSSRTREDLLIIDDKHWKDVQRKYLAIKDLIKTPKYQRDTEQIEEVAKESGVNKSTIYRWLSDYERYGSMTSLSRMTRRDKGTRKLQPEVEEVIQNVIEELYLTRERKTQQEVCLEVRRRCKRKNLTLPNHNTVIARIKVIPHQVRAKARYGKKGIEKHQPVRGHFHENGAPLSLVQIDHTPLDIILVDDIDRKPIGKPWITLAIDVATRMVAGFYVGFEPPSAMSVGLCLSSAMLSKDILLAKHDIDAEWPVWGKIQTVHADNAKEFRGDMVRRACQNYGIDLEWRAVGKTNWGGHIERYLGTLLTKIHGMKGTTFSNTQERGDYPSEKEAIFSLKEFEKILLIKIVEEYHQTIHSEIKTTPYDKWMRGIFGDDDQKGVGLPRKIEDEERFRIDFMPYKERTVQSYGIVIDEVHYYSDVLRRWINCKDPKNSRVKRKFIVRRDPRDISYIYFLDPELNRYFKVPYRDTRRPAISIWELRECQRYLKEQGEKAYDEEKIFLAHEKLKEIEENSRSKTIKARKRNAIRQKVLQDRIEEVIPQPENTETELDDELFEDIQPFDDIDTFGKS
ncbi:Mu transposase C-terminal domain-containing protein [Kangiella shandongensis]|uniref:Mu transposase C-terminal domain-containing protein n=1 Tax=Kangiella shandongensis TaxID=2763258 RepID=UPI001CBE6DB6|nr:Mu transposase C-terminal domain-containing protein [Kangiella shandongensis]